MTQNLHVRLATLAHVSAIVAIGAETFRNAPNHKGVFKEKATSKPGIWRRDWTGRNTYQREPREPRSRCIVAVIKDGQGTQTIVGASEWVNSQLQRVIHTNSQQKPTPRAYPTFIDVEALRGTLREMGRLIRSAKENLGDRSIDDMWSMLPRNCESVDSMKLIVVFSSSKYNVSGQKIQKSGYWKAHVGMGSQAAALSGQDK